MKRLGAFALLVGVLATTPLRAAEPRRVVVVVSASDAARAESVLGAIRAQLGDLPVALVVEAPGQIPKELRDRLDFAARACKEHDAVGAFFVEAEREDDLLLYLIEPQAKRALVRRVKRSVGAEQAGVEEASIIVRSTVGALLEGREIGMEAGPELAAPPKPPPPKPPPPVKPSPAPTRPKPEAPVAGTGRLAAHYAGEAYAPEATWQSGLGVELSGSPDSQLFFGLGYVAYAPVEVETESARVRVARHPVRLFVAYEIPAARFRFAGQLGFIGELDRRSTTKTSGGVLPTESADGLTFALSPRVTAHYQVWQRTHVWVGVGLDIFLKNSEYVAELPGRTESLLSPYRTRAEASVGLSVDLW